MRIGDEKERKSSGNDIKLDVNGLNAWQGFAAKAVFPPEVVGIMRHLLEQTIEASLKGMTPWN
ncbi:hypothetical protein [Bradyrhizobium centrolobii]|uniref:hypothetical protein n=1 Tax=Bradyrhizobium centrolobii TaxID=1505087 RepID=UPI0007C471E9|nr:hypothetical protein [Bradyrhizobium centrolobii]